MESTLLPQALPEEILTVEQVAQRLQLKRSWVYAHADQLGVYRAGKYLRFRWQRVLERLEQLPSGMSDQQPNTPTLRRRIV
jgi:hypothetical protein